MVNIISFVMGYVKWGIDGLKKLVITINLPI